MFIYKKGNKKDCNNYQGITVMNTVNRLYKVLKELLCMEYIPLNHKKKMVSERSGWQSNKFSAYHKYREKNGKISRHTFALGCSNKSI